jgi:hypothetical protein
MAPIPDTMILVEKGGKFVLSLGLTEREFDTLSLCNIRMQRELWRDWSTTVDGYLNNKPDDLKDLDEIRLKRQQTVQRAQNHLAEGIDLTEHYRALLQAYEDAGEEGLTMEEGIDAVVRIAIQRNSSLDASHDSKPMRDSWANRYRAMHRDLRKVDFIIETGEKRPTASSRAMAKAKAVRTGEPTEPRNTAKAWRLRNLGAC